MNHRANVVFALLFASLVACSGEPRPAAVPEPEAPAPPTAPAAPVAETRDPTPEELPLPEDFEVEAEQKITPDNFRTELDAIEKEMDSEK